MAIIKKFRIKSFKQKKNILKLKNISLSFQNRTILDNINFEIKTETYKLKNIFLKTLAFTYLNPHVYSDTVFFLGNLSKNFELADKYSFGVGASISSFLFFFILGYLSKFSSNYLKNPRIWKIINNFIILFMGGIALFVLREIINYY